MWSDEDLADTVLSETPHIADRPSWLCGSCRTPWPCYPAKGWLLIEYDECYVSLRLYMAIQMGEAINDLLGPGALMTDEIHARFIGWVTAYVRHVVAQERADGASSVGVGGWNSGACGNADGY